MGAEDKNASVRNVFDGFDEYRTPPPQLLYNVRVVDDFMVDVNRRSVSLQRQFDNIHRSHHSRTEAAWANPQQNLPVICLHRHPNE
jgi:hypothetical protein